MNYLDNIVKLLSELENTDILLQKDNKEIETKKLYKEAYDYLLSHTWCNSIDSSWIAVSWGYILGVFLFEITSDIAEVDKYVWVVVGDIPPAYIDVQSVQDPIDVISSYIDIMSDWVKCVENDESTEDCYPVEVPATVEYAKMLKSRLEVLSKEVQSIK